MKRDSRDVRRLRGVILASLLSTLGSVRAATFELPPAGTDVVGDVSTVIAAHDDTLIDIAHRYGFGYEDMVRANPDVNPWLPGEGTEIVLPGRFVLPAVPREGIVLNIAEFRMYFFPPARAGEPAVVMTFPISVGRQDWATPIGLTRVVNKVTNPSWYPPQSVRDEHAADGRPLPPIVPPGPDNPLGTRALRLGLPTYLIHGTNKPAGVGMRVTHGCVRMFPEDIEYLFDHVPVDTKVRIINDPVKIGWDGDELVMEVHPVLAGGAVATSDEPSPESAVVDEAEPAEPLIVPAEKDPLTYATEQFITATAERRGQLDWSLVEAAIERSDGLPVVVGTGIKNAATSAAFD
jgi:L,D-transpeptidase ErfK/SrfK